MDRKTWASIPLRLGLGIVFIAHGLQKAFGMFDGPGIQGFSGWLSTLGFRPPLLWAYIAACVELVGGICVLIGLGTRIACALLFIQMAAAMIIVHLPNGFFASRGGIELTLVLALMCVSLGLLGSGKYGLNSKL